MPQQDIMSKYAEQYTPEELEQLEKYQARVLFEAMDVGVCKINMSRVKVKPFLGS